MQSPSVMGRPLEFPSSMNAPFSQLWREGRLERDWVAGARVVRHGLVEQLNEPWEMGPKDAGTWRERSSAQRENVIAPRSRLFRSVLLLVAFEMNYIPFLKPYSTTSLGVQQRSLSSAVPSPTWISAEQLPTLRLPTLPAEEIRQPI